VLELSDPPAVNVFGDLDDAPPAPAPDLDATTRGRTRSDRGRVAVPRDPRSDSASTSSSSRPIPAPLPLALGDLGHHRGMEDSTRPTRVLGQLTLQRPPKKPWPAIAAGTVLGLILCTGAVAWRLGTVDAVLLRLRPRLVAWGVVDAPVTTPSLSPSPHAPVGPLAKHARVRVTSEPPGADVLEVQDGLPRLLGVTPLSIDWTIDGPKSRELLLRKEGWKPSAASIAPPPLGPTDPVWVDVEAKLRPR
jgi:hypothetical protein